MRASRVAWALAATALSGPALAAPAAIAAEEAPPASATGGGVRDDDEIVVNGEADRRSGDVGSKTGTPLIQLPQTVTVIDQDELVRRNALSINQALGYVAGVAPNQRGNVATRYDQLFIRGFTPGVYMDGMRLLGGVYSTPQIDFHLVEKVDVIKGPASVLYGNSTPGGLVNLTSKVPYREAGGRIELAGGNYDLARGAIDVNQPLDAAGTWLFRVIAGGERSDGFLTRTTNERYYARPMLTFAPDAATTLTLILNYQRDPKSAAYSGVPVYGSALVNPLGRFPVDLNVSEPSYEQFDRRQKSATLLFRHDLTDRISWTTNVRYLDVRLNYRQIYLSAFATTGTGANRQTDYATIVRGGGGADEHFHTLTIDNRILAHLETGPFTHTLLAGLDWQSNRGWNDQQFNTGQTANPVTSIPNFTLFSPNYGGVIPSFALTQVRNQRTIDQVGVYLQDQIAWGGLQLIASGRWDWYEQVTRNRNIVNTSVGAVTRLEQNAFTTRLGALYQTKFGLAPFFSYSESFEPQTGTGISGNPFVPVTGRQYEGGFKYQTRDGKALFTTSVYDLRRRNVPVADPANPQFSIQVGEVRVRGVELDGRGEIRPGLDVTVAATYTDARVLRGTPMVGTGAQQSGVTGTRPLGVPKWSASSFVTYDLKHAATGPLGGLTIGGGARYVGESDGIGTRVVNGATVVDRFPSPDFVLFDLVGLYDLGQASGRLRGFTAAVNVANLFNRRHIASCFFTNSCYFGASRTVVGTLRYSW